ncbi:MAG: hypothetical protein IT307_18060 [Chloroflexi bacterium]|nr:hypothetical protein [Chloroflexota bacterium]
MLTQLVRYGHMLKVDLKSARCHVTTSWTVEGSVFAGTIESKCVGVESRVEVESHDEPARVAALLRNAKGGCFAEAAMREPVPVSTTMTLNGEPIDFEQYPRRVERR